MFDKRAFIIPGTHGYCVIEGIVFASEAAHSMAELSVADPHRSKPGERMAVELDAPEEEGFAYEAVGGGSVLECAKLIRRALGW